MATTNFEELKNKIELAELVAHRLYRQLYPSGFSSSVLSDGYEKLSKEEKEKYQTTLQDYNEVNKKLETFYQEALTAIKSVK